MAELTKVQKEMLGQVEPEPKRLTHQPSQKSQPENPKADGPITYEDAVPIGEDTPIEEKEFFPDVDASLYDDQPEDESLIRENGLIRENVPPGCIGKQEFFEGVFAPAHDLPAAYFHLESLPIKKHEIESARAASDAVWNVCARVEHLHFLIKPSNFWVQNLVMILAYMGPKTKMLLAEIRWKRDQAMKEAEAVEESGADGN